MIYTLISTHLIEMAKIPMLYDHYVEHKKSDNKLDFMDFLMLHYSNSGDDKDKSHTQLPFKSVKEISSFSSVIISENYTMFVQNDFVVIFTKIINHYKADYSFSLFEKIWQPPRF